MRDMIGSALSKQGAPDDPMQNNVKAAPTEPETPTSHGSALEEIRDFGRVYSEHSRSIYYLALRYLGSPAQAEDVTHDVFLKAFRKRDAFRGQSSARTWLYRIAINHCKNIRQSWHSRKIHSTDDPGALDRGSGGVDSPQKELEIKELGQRIQATLDLLPDDYRLLLLLVADEELSYAEVATVTEQSVDAVRGKLHRARKAFASRFDQLKN
ncbi:MAG: RNA polymerase sigma factor [Verrucomicrobiales bacterium]